MQDYANTGEYKKLTWAVQNGSRKMEKEVTLITMLLVRRYCDESLITLFKKIHYMDKEFLIFSKFPTLCILLLTVNANITTKMYHDDKACADMLAYIAGVIKKKYLIGLDIYNFLASWWKNQPIFLF